MGRTIPELETDIKRLNLHAQEYHKMAEGKDALVVRLKAELVVAKQMLDAETWPRFAELQDEIQSVLDLDSKRVAASVALGWNRPYEHTLRSAYDHVLTRTLDRESPKKRIDAAFRYYYEPLLLKVSKPMHYSRGARVQYKPNLKKAALWQGVVIPRPAGSEWPTYSLVTRGELTYVMRDHDHAIRGVFAKNLERVL